MIRRILIILWLGAFSCSTSNSLEPKVTESQLQKETEVASGKAEHKNHTAQLAKALAYGGLSGGCLALSCFACNLFKNVCMEQSSSIGPSLFHNQDIQSSQFRKQPLLTEKNGILFASLAVGLGSGYGSYVFFKRSRATLKAFKKSI